MQGCLLQLMGMWCWLWLPPCWLGPWWVGLTLVALGTGLAGLVVDCLIVGVRVAGEAHGIPGSLTAAHHPTTCSRAQHIGG